MPFGRTRGREQDGNVRFLRLLPCLCFVAAFFCPTAQANPGTPDPSFGTGGIVKYQLGYGNYRPASEFEALGTGPSGSIYAAGVSLDSGGGFEVLSARLSESGALDPSFAGTGWLRSYPVETSPSWHDEWADALSVEPDGAVVLGGPSMIERISASGSSTELLAERNSS